MIRAAITLLQLLYCIGNAVGTVVAATSPVELNCFLESFWCKESFLLFRGACRVLSASLTGSLRMSSFAWAFRMIWKIMPGRLDACDWCVPSFVRSRRKATTSAARMLCSGFAEAINLYICTLVNISSQLQLRHIQPVPV